MAPDDALEDIARLAAWIFGAPVALIGLVDGESQTQRARVGPELGGAARELAFCGDALGAGRTLVVRDPQLSVGIPLKGPTGAGLGALCVFDRVPREPGPQQLLCLEILGRQVVGQLELRRASLETERFIQEWRNSEARYRDFFENASDLVQVVSPEGGIRYCNRAWRDTLGYGEADAEQLRFLDVVHADDRERCATTLAGLLAGGPPVRLEVDFVSRGGERVPVEGMLSGRVLGGQPESARGIFREVSARRRAERLQTALNDATQALFEGLSVEDTLPKVLMSVARSCGWDFGAFWRMDRYRNVLRAAATWASDPEAFVAFEDATRAIVFPKGSGLPGRILESGEAHYIADLQRDANFPRARFAAQVGLVSGFGFPLALGGDVLGTLEFFAREMPAPDEETRQKLANLASQVAQFLERDAADQALRESDTRMRSIIENMLEGLLVTDERAFIQSVNPAAEQIFGYAAWELQGKHLKVLMPRSLGNPEAYVADVFAKAIGKVSEWEGRRKSGELFRFELSLYELWTPEGRHFAGNIRDISERRKLERMKKEFVATVSHELRTPLTSIRGSLSLLVGGALGELPDEALDVIKIAERNTIRLITLINDILDLERLEAGKLELQVSPVPLASVIERSLEAVRGMADQNGISLEAGPTKATVLADADRLVQVLVNLLSNAIKFSPKGANVTVATTAPEPGLAEVRVVDQGRGIPDSHKDLLFQRFQQVEASDSRQKGGTGLGLAICKTILEQHGGTIGVESERGKGSTFWFRVPTPRTAEIPEAEDLFLGSLAGALEPSERPDVLIIDDDLALLGVLARQLVQQGLRVRAAATGREGVTHALRSPPRLLVLDIGLPDIDGFSVIEALRAEPALRNLRVLVYTNWDLNTAQRDRLTLGPTRFLVKSRGGAQEFQALVADLLAQAGAAGGGT